MHSLPIIMAYTSLLPAFCNSTRIPVDYPPPLPTKLRRTLSSSPFSPQYNPQTHRDQPLVPRDAQHGVVTGRPASSRVDHDVDVLIKELGGRLLTEHDLKLFRLEHGLRTVEGQAGKLGFDEIRPVSHHGTKHLVTSSGLPAAARPSGFKLSKEEQDREDALWHQM